MREPRYTPEQYEKAQAQQRDAIADYTRGKINIDEMSRVNSAVFKIWCHTWGDVPECEKTPLAPIYTRKDN